MRTPALHRGLDRRRRRIRASRASLAVLSLFLVGGAGCGDRAGQPRRAELEERYGPRPAATDTVPETSVSGASADTASHGTGAREPERPGADSSSDARSDSPGPEPERTVATAQIHPADAPVGETRPTLPPPVDTTLGTVGADGQEFDVAALLTEAESAYESLASLRASFVQVMEVPLLERISSGTGIWYQKGQNRFRMDFEDPPDDEIVADGTYLWLYHPSQNPDQVIRAELGVEGTDSGTADFLARILREARMAYDAQYDGRERLEGAEMHVVTLTPNGRSPYRSVRIWVGTRDRLVRRFRIVEVNESIRTVTLSDLEPNAALADSLFQFTVPPGADVFSG